MAEDNNRRFAAQRQKDRVEAQQFRSTTRILGDMIKENARMGRDSTALFAELQRVIDAFQGDSSVAA